MLFIPFAWGWRSQEHHQSPALGNSCFTPISLYSFTLVLEALCINMNPWHSKHQATLPVLWNSFQPVHYYARISTVDQSPYLYQDFRTGQDLSETVLDTKRIKRKEWETLSIGSCCHKLIIYKNNMNFSVTKSSTFNGFILTVTILKFNFTS